ncbi:amidase [Xylogone sp. PMI_703]|nr:amidase [Xylogone sp. PMI_703]
MATTESWEVVAKRKRDAVNARIPPAWRLSAPDIERYKKSDKGVLYVPSDCGVLSPAEVRITEKYDAVALTLALQSGALSAVDVTTAFCKRAAIAQQLTNCLTEIFFEDALTRAKYLDEYFLKEGKTIGPFHGLPISIKDSFKFPGVESTIGYVSFIGKTMADTPSPLVKILLDLGAVLYVKTNIPQTLMTADSDNNVFGRTLNPHKLSLTAGGSSGGEGALVAMRGSILGVGTDIGGSIRIPALCCGTYGFKPSANRIPYGGQQGPGRAGSPGIVAAAGPLATTFRDLEFFMRHVISKVPQNYDSSALPMPWCPVEVKKNLTIGVFKGDPEYPVSPPVARAITTAVKILEAAGHTIVLLKNTPALKESDRLCRALFSLDNTKVPFQHIKASGEPFIRSVEKTLFIVDAKPKGYTLEELYDLNVARASYNERWNNVFVHNKLDVVLCPGAETTAVPHDTYGNAPYTGLWNVLNYPGVMIPFLKADKSIDTEDLYPSGAKRKYNAADVNGAPCSIQLTSRNLRDESLLDAARIIAADLESAKKTKSLL